jgi:hypothetical protein
VNHSRKFGDDQLWHCYCVIGGVAYDANGPHSIEEASNTSEERWAIPDMDKTCDVVMQWRQVDTDWLADVHEDFNCTEYPPLANEFIEQNRHLFPVYTTPTNP